MMQNRIWSLPKNHENTQHCASHENLIQILLTYATGVWRVSRSEKILTV